MVLLRVNVFVNVIGKLIYYEELNSTFALFESKVSLRCMHKVIHRHIVTTELIKNVLGL